MGDKKSSSIDVAELEARVHVAELRAREIEAEVRLATAMATRRALRKNIKEQHKLRMKSERRRIKEKQESNSAE